MENRYHLTTQMMKEYTRRTRCLVYLVLGIVITLAGILRIIINVMHEISDNMFLYILAIVAGIFVAFFTPALMTRELINEDKKRFKNKRPQTTVKFSDKIEMKEGPITRVVEYAEIQKVVTMKHTIALIVAPRDAILLSREGFYNCKEAEVLALLKENCPGVRGL